MTAKDAKTDIATVEPEISLDDIKRRANQVKDLAVTETKRVAAEAYNTDVTKAALIIVGVVVVAASLAYFLGTHAGRRSFEPPFEA